MNFAFILILTSACIAKSLQPMNNREQHIRKYLHQKILRHYMQHQVEEKLEKNYKRNVARNQKPRQNSTFKAALTKFSNCNRLQMKMMIRYRNRPRLLRRISNLSLKCWTDTTFLAFVNNTQKIKHFLSLVIVCKKFWRIIGHNYWPTDYGP